MPEYVSESSNLTTPGQIGEGSAAETSYGARLARLRHELCTPLSALIGYCEMLIDDLDNAPIAERLPSLQKIWAMGKHLVTQVNALLDPAAFSRDPCAPEGDAFGRTLYSELNPVVQMVLAETGDLVRYYEQAKPLQVREEIQKVHDAVLCFQNLLLNMPAAMPGDIGGDAFSSATQPELPSDLLTNVPTQISGRRFVADTAFRPGKVLVVEDNPLNRDLLVRYLERQGHVILTANHGQHALDLLADGSFDLILLDIMMPVMNGFEVLAALKRHPLWREIPVLMISAMDEMTSVVRCIEMGAEDFLSKPFDAVLFNARVNTCLEKKRLRDMEIEYLRQVRVLTDAAAAVEMETFDPASVTAVAGRADELGQLARVFQRMAHEVTIRQQRLQYQVQALQIELDEVRQQRHLREITETEYFRQLRSQAEILRGLMRET